MCLKKLSNRFMNYQIYFLNLLLHELSKTLEPQFISVGLEENHRVSNQNSKKTHQLNFFTDKNVICLATNSSKVSAKEGCDRKMVEFRA